MNPTKITQLEIGSKWKHKTSDDVYVVVEQYSHRVVLKHELTGETIKVTIGHLNPEGFDEYRAL
jgi:hypothetical protein